MSDNECDDHQGQGVSRRRSTIVSFSKDKDEISIDGAADRDDEYYQMALAPYIQSYLEHSVETMDCCGIGFPVPFERASRRSWWDPRFDSEILEGQYRKSSFTQVRLRFRYALVYLIILTVCWSLYLMALGVLDKTYTDAFPLSLIYFFFVILASLVLLFTKSSLYRQHALPASILITLAMCALSLASVSQTPVLSPASDFAICVEILMIIYTVIPLPMYLIVLISLTYSVVFELLGTGFWPAKICLHLSVHLIGSHIFIMTNVRMRGTFMKVGQSLLVRRQLEMEKQLKEKMIHSVMPQDVARWLLEEEGGLFANDDIDSLFRPFNMSCMKDVSILFADIVGFTKMSSNKTASQLVTVLNELFERFDELCVHNGCEKIATLGDCYYCVSGCPTARQDHAQCCVEMGLGMIRAIAEFDEEKHEDINMRVGVHTGTVLCGIVGRRRFKFDVWGNDVTLANKMESSGRPGQVHISEATRRFLGDLYILEKGEEYHGLDTFFIVTRKHDIVIEDTTQATITSLTSTTLMTTDNSFETALMSNTESLVTAPSQTRSAKSSSHVNCTISPFDTITDSRLFTETSTTPSPPSNLPHLLCLSEMLPEDVKATSLPNVFARDSGSGRPSILGSGPLLTRKPLPSWKYSRLKLNSLDVENGKIQKTYKVFSSGEPSPVEKVLAPNNQLEVPKDDLSFCHSVNSRKDSGIRSCNSRRSSIQNQLFALNGVQSDLMNHRVSGYYTSSQSSLNGSFQGKYKNACRLPAPLTDSLGACFQKIRKQSDLQLIRCVQDNSKSERNYFVTPPLKRWSLLFKYPDMEKEYREKAHRASPRGENYSRTLATARYNTYFDITISFIVFASVSLSLFILFSLNIPWMTTFLLLLGIQLAVLSLCLYSIAMPIVTKRLAPFLNWYPWHAIGGVLVSLPVIAVLSNYEFSSMSKESVFVYSCAIYVGLVHYCNFTQLNCWMKSSFATVGGFIYLILATSTVLAKPQLWAVDNATFDDSNFTNVGFSSAIQFLYDSSDFRPMSISHSQDDPLHPEFGLSDSQVETLRRSYFFIAETYLSVFLVVLMVWFLNREFEISYRLSFHGNAVAAKDKAKVEKMKVQAEKLLYNIIPKHVAEHLKTTVRYRYSEDIKNVGIIFASVINFGEMYDESYLDGRECLRVLNELVSDFDDLLSEEKFSMVEKIKTIGATFMAASGLNPSERKQESNEHLFQLMEFAFALQNAMENFNTHLLSFKLILRIGFNFGDVTAGVIGTNKLHYDIWGDAVNIASRMDSTGMANRIQVPVSCVPVLSQRYRLEHRGTVFVKGKDNMDVYLIKDRIEPPSVENPTSMKELSSQKINS
uniref:Adenylate cyclase type 9 n=3 Tax=Lygus hesperus TaxID=30085 RepID=A0A146LLR0_LYGHE